MIDQILASSGGTQESDKKAETSEQTRTEESGDAMKDIVPEKQVTRKWLLPAGIGMALCRLPGACEKTKFPILTF